MTSVVTLEQYTEIVSVSMHPCDRCEMCFCDYRLLLEHLYWKHGTESESCSDCNLKRWIFAEHMCHVLPIFINLPDDEPEYCYCGMTLDAPMIGCDGPDCAVQWFHFPCVGIATPPDGDWFCPECRLADIDTPQTSPRDSTLA